MSKKFTLWHWLGVSLSLFTLLGLAGCTSPLISITAELSEETNVAQFVSTSVPIPTITNTPRPTFTWTSQPRRVNSPLATPTPQVTRTRKATKTATRYPLPTLTSTRTPSPSPTLTPTPSATFSPTPTPFPQPTPLLSATEIVVQVPILMYHYLSVPPADADIYRQDLSVTPENFESQLRYLQENGFTSISPDDLVLFLSGNGNLPEKPVLLTFDDGYVDNYTNAFPLLKKYGFQATFSLMTEAVDFNDPRYLSWEQVQEMHQAGMTIGAHTRRHPDLRERSEAYLLDEITGSKEDIEAKLGTPVRFFVYPAGRYDDKTLDIVQQSEFWLAVTTQYGYEHVYSNRFVLPRVRISNEDNLSIFAAKVEAAFAE